MLKPLLIGIALATAAGPVFAQGNTQRNCLHAPIESAAERARRQQALDYVTKVNLAESALTRLAPRGYRPLEELINLPAVPAGFALQFHSDDRSYTVSLKDTRDACHYAVFSDQDGLLYEGVPRPDAGAIVLPLGATR